MTTIQRVFVLMKRLIITGLICIVCIISSTSCSEEKASTEKEKNTSDAKPTSKKQSASADIKHGELPVLLDSAKHPALAQLIDSIFSASPKSMYPPEPFFKVRFLNPAKVTDNDYTNTIALFPYVLDGGQATKSGTLTDDIARSLEQKSEAGKPVVKQKGNQAVLCIPHRSFIELKETITGKGDKLMAKLHDLKVNAVKKTFEAREHDSRLTSKLKRTIGFGFALPDGYEIEKIADDHVWIRNKVVVQKDVEFKVGSGTRTHKEKTAQTTDFNILATWQPYRDKSQFNKEQIISFRDSVCKKIWSEKEKGVYMYTEDAYVPVDYKEVTFLGQFAAKLYGHWAIQHKGQGGSFVSYTFYDEHTDRLYYLEGFVYAPGQHKLPLLRTLEAILQTFETV